MPNPLPRFSGSESAIIASRDAVLIPFPTRSNPLKIRICCQRKEKDKKSLNTAEVRYPEKTNIFRFPVLSDQ